MSNSINTCEDYRSAVSPLAYLRELLNYINARVKNKTNNTDSFITAQNLQGCFHQPFQDFPITREMVENKVRQVRICIEVLRDYIKDGKKYSNSEYIFQAYNALLGKIGTSFEELRLATTAKPEIRQALATRLGITLGDNRPDELDMLLKQHDEITEEELEKLFGLIDTTRNPLFTGELKRSDGRPLFNWQINGVAWNKNTDSNGNIYVQFRKGTKDQKVYYTAKLFKDSDCKLQVAETEDGSVELPFSELNGSGLSGILERFSIANSNYNFQISALPDVLSWRLQYLRNVWKEQEWSANPYDKKELPTVDPDLIGPDDFRFPTSDNPLFALWQKRRTWIDALLVKFDDARLAKTSDKDKLQVLFDRMSDLTAYGAVRLRVWSNPQQKKEAILDIKNKLLNGQDLEDIKKWLSDHYLTMESFSKVSEITLKTVNADKVEEGDWLELLSILVQTCKEKFKSIWITEESNVKPTNALPAGADLDPRNFWIAQKPHADGDWSPALHPVIDPENIALKDFQDTLGEQKAIEKWQERKNLLDSTRQQIISTYNAKHLQGALLFALGEPPAIPSADPNQPLKSTWPDVLDYIDTELKSYDKTKREAAQARIEQQLQMTLEDFNQAMFVKQKEDNPGSEITTEEIETLAAILTHAHKKCMLLSQWAKEEVEQGLEYWRILKARLPQWRASQLARALWQQTLLNNCQPPNINPDIISESDLARTKVNNPAFSVWENRKEWIAQRIELMKNEINKSVNNFSNIIENAIGVRIEALLSLQSTFEQGDDISNRLDQLALTFDGLSYLLRINTLLENKATVLESEWDEVYSILVGAQKSLNFAAWRNEEKNRNLTLSPDYFVLSEEKPQDLPAWRFSWQERWDWEDKLRSRFDQEKNVYVSLAEVVDECEQETLPILRDALIDSPLTLQKGEKPTLEEHEREAKRLNEILYIDCMMSPCQQTTRAAQMINTLQNLVFSVRTGQYDRDDVALTLDISNFEQEWTWMGSYEPWKAAVGVSLYPENILMPSLRRRQTPMFQRLVKELGSGTLTPQKAHVYANQYSDYFFDVCNLKIEATCQTMVHFSGAGCTILNGGNQEKGDKELFFMFGRGGQTNAVYWSTYDLDATHDQDANDQDFAQSFWDFVPGLEKTLQIVGAAPYKIADDAHHIYLFAVTKARGEKKLVFTKYDLNRHTWDPDVTDLELPKEKAEEAPDFQVVIKQTQQEDFPPCLGIRLPSGSIYYNSLNRDGNDWKDDEWIPLVGWAKGCEFGALCAIVEINKENDQSDDFYVFVSSKTAVYYRLFGSLDDRTWKKIDMSNDNDLVLFHGCFAAKSDKIRCFVNYYQGSKQAIESIVASEFMQKEWNTIESFDNWCKEVAGVSISDVKVRIPIPNEPSESLMKILTLGGESFPSYLAYIDKDGKSRSFNEDQMENWKAALCHPLIWNYSIRNICIGQFCKIVEEANCNDPIYGQWTLLKREAIKSSGRSLHEIYLYLSGSHPQSTPGTIVSIAYMSRQEGEIERTLYTHYLDFKTTCTASESIKRMLTYEEIRPSYPQLKFTNLGNFDCNKEKELLDKLKGVVPILLNKQPTELQICTDVSSLLLNNRRTSIHYIFREEHNLNNKTTQTYFKEAWYFIPMLLAQALQNSGEYMAALDWLKTIYNYDAAATDDPNTPLINERKIYYGLQEEDQQIEVTAEPMWEIDPMDVHLLAETRKNNTYTKFTLFTIIKCLLAHADAEFTRDTAESIVKARTLYETAWELLSQSEFTVQPQVGSSEFCVPENPMLWILNQHAENNLYKIRTCRNIAGIKRDIEPYAAPIDILSAMPSIGPGGQLSTPTRIIPPPLPYRYEFLIERAKQLVSMATQMEGAFLSAMEKRDAELYNQFKARQDIQLARAGVKLQNLRHKQSYDELKLAELQKESAQIQKSTYEEWMSSGLNSYEETIINNYESMRLSKIAGVGFDAALQALQVWAAANNPYTQGYFAGAAAAAQAGKNVAETLSIFYETTIQIASIKASYARRMQELQLQRDLAQQSVRIGNQQIKIATDGVNIIEQEKNIAEMQVDHAEAVIEFLQNKETSYELYAWMSGILEETYRYFLQQATSMARLAQMQLAFERQELPPSFIQDDYWDKPLSGQISIAAENTVNRHGLTGSARLFADIYKLDQYRVETEKRKLQLTKTISLAQIAPYEFQRFKETGLILFGTLMDMFDRDFPGHYLRLIKRVRTSVIALIPPMQGIKATLTNIGTSRIVLNNNGLFQSKIASRPPESVALTSPMNATGLFELEMQPEMLLPFEGLGVDTMWEFRLPKAANQFDYDTIADIIFTIDYTALDSYDYRQQVIAALPSKLTGERPYSFRYQFSDQWYDLLNPAQSNKPMSVTFRTRREDFPPNVKDLKIDKVLLYFVRKEGAAFEVEASLAFNGTEGCKITTENGIISTQRGSGFSWALILDSNNRQPAGTWQLKITNPANIQQRFKNEEIIDILFVLSFSGRTPEWPE